MRSTGIMRSMRKIMRTRKIGKGRMRNRRKSWSTMRIRRSLM